MSLIIFLLQNSSNDHGECPKSYERDRCIHKETWGLRYHGDLLISAKWMNCMRFLMPRLNRIKQVLHGLMLLKVEGPLLQKLAEGCLTVEVNSLLWKLPFISKNKDTEEEIIEEIIELFLKKHLYCLSV